MHQQTKKLIQLLAKYKKKRGEMSDGLEGALRAIAAIAPWLEDRDKLARAITTACKRFDLGEQKRTGFEVTNRYAAAALAALAKETEELSMAAGFIQQHADN